MYTSCAGSLGADIPMAQRSGSQLSLTENTQPSRSRNQSSNSVIVASFSISNAGLSNPRSEASSRATRSETSRSRKFGRGYFESRVKKILVRVEAPELSARVGDAVKAKLYA
jgi:hypothetical protein